MRILQRVLEIVQGSETGIIRYIPNITSAPSHFHVTFDELFTNVSTEILKDLQKIEKLEQKSQFKMLLKISDDQETVEMCNSCHCDPCDCNWGHDE